MEIGNLPPVLQKDRIVAIGIEGSANKIGVGLYSWYFEAVSLIFCYIKVFLYMKMANI